MILIVDSVTISHEGYLEILITALGVLITVLAVLLAVFGFFGYASLKQSLAEVAEKVARATAEEVAAETYRRELNKRVSDITKKAVSSALKAKESLEQGKALSKEQFADAHAQIHDTKRETRTPRCAKKRCGSERRCRCLTIKHMGRSSVSISNKHRLTSQLLQTT